MEAIAVIHRAALGHVFLLVFFVTHGVAHALPMGDRAFGTNLLLADINGDQVLSGLDFIVFRGCYGQGGPDCESADLDGNEVVDIIDFGFFAAAYANPVQVVTPEPGTLLLVAAGCLLLAAKKRKRGR